MGSGAEKLLLLVTLQVGAMHHSYRYERDVYNAGLLVVETQPARSGCRHESFPPNHVKGVIIPTSSRIVITNQLHV